VNPCWGPGPPPKDPPPESCTLHPPLLASAIASTLATPARSARSPAARHATRRGPAGPSRRSPSSSSRFPGAAAPGRLRQALEKGGAYFLATVREPDALAAIRLTLLTVAIAVPANVVRRLGRLGDRQVPVPGQEPLTTLIDLPFAVSPVISGLIYVLVFGAQGWLGPWLIDHNIRIIFAVPGIVLATTFVTFPVRRPRADPAHAGAGHRRGVLRGHAWGRAAGRPSGG
jgi:ABC-type sugar transport system permease subunit